MPTEMAPAWMLPAQSDLVERIRNNEGFIRLAVQMIAQSLGSSDLGEVAMDDGKTRTVATLMSLMLQSSTEARCYHVSKDMCALIQHAAAGLDESDIIDFSALAPSFYGLVRFDDGGLELIDPRGEVMKMDWLLWGDCAFVDEESSFESQVLRNDRRITGEGFAIWEFNDRIDNPDGISQDINQKIPKRRLDQVMGRWNIMGSHVVMSGTTVGPAMVMAEGEQLRKIIADGDTPVPATNSLRLLHAFWLLLNQPITEQDMARLTGPARKAAKAKGLKRAQMDKEVSVVRLSRSARQAKATSDSQKRHVEWQGQWYVNGFWRWQAYGEGRKQRKRIWVDGFVKGPADKPLIVRKHVYTVRP